MKFKTKFSNTEYIPRFLHQLFSCLHMEDDEFVEKVCTQLAELIRNSPYYKSNRDFALNAGIDEKTLRLILQGKHNMSLKILKRICDALNISVSNLIESSK